MNYIIESINEIKIKLEIAIIVFSFLILIISFLKPSNSQEALNSITGGSSKLFEVKKKDLFKSLIWVITLILILIFIILMILFRVIINHYLILY